VPNAPADAVPDGAVPAEAQDQDGGVRQAAEAFAAELIRLRTGYGLSQSDLARRMGYNKSYVTHVERCTQAPTQPFARLADQALGSGEALTRLWHGYHTAHAAARRCQNHALPYARPTADAPDDPDPDAVAEHDTPHGPGEHASASSAPGTDSSEHPAVPPGIDLRGATGVQFGNGNTQNFTL
jgi:transcriptional regulator with XRE-family HTH domain